MALTPGFDQGAQERLSFIPGPDGRDGTLRGGDSFSSAYGTYTCANGKWKGEVTNREHTPTFGALPVWERKVVTIGSAGTYTDETAESDGIALAGKQSIRFKSKLRLLIPD